MLNHLMVSFISSGFWFGLGILVFLLLLFFVLFLGQGLSRAHYGNQAILKPPKCWDDRGIGHSGFTHPKETPSQGASGKRRKGATFLFFCGVWKSLLLVS